MANEPTLAVVLQASLDKFTDQMKSTGAIAQSAVDNIENTFARANPSFGQGFLQGLAQGFGQNVMGQVIGGVEKAVTKILDMIDALAKLREEAKLAAVDVISFQRAMALGTDSGRSATESAGDLGKLAGILNDSLRNENDLTRLLDANSKKYKDQAGNVISINEALKIAADLIRNARTEIDKIDIARAFGLPADWVKTLQQGGSAVDAIMTNAKVASAEVTKAAEDFKAEWSKALKLIGDGSVDWLAPLITTLKEAVAIVNQLNKVGNTLNTVGSLSRLSAGTATSADLDRIETTDDDAVRQMRARRSFRAQIAARRAELDLPATEEQSAEAESIRESQRGRGYALRGAPKGPQTVIPPKSTGTDEERDAFDKASDAIARHNALLIADNATVGKTAGVHEQLRVEMRLLEAAKQSDVDITQAQMDRYAELRGTMSAQQALQAAGIKLTEDQAAAFLKLSDTTRVLVDNLEKTKTTFAGVNDAMRFAGNQLVDVIDRATQKGAKFGDIMADVLRNVSKQLLQAAITGEGAFAKLFGTASTTGGVGGIFGLLTKGLGGVGGNPAVSGAPGVVGIAGNTPVPTFLAEGGTIQPGGLAYVGEHGPNPRLIRAGSQPIMVTPNDVGGSGSGLVSGPVTHINIEGSADQSTIAMMQQMLAARDRRFMADVASATRELHRRSVRT